MLTPTCAPNSGPLAGRYGPAAGPGDTLESMASNDDRADDAASFVSDLVALVLPTPGAAVATRRLTRALTAERARRTSVALEVAERLAGRTREQLAEELAADPALHSLMVRLAYSLGMNGYDPTLRAMGSALGDAVREPERADECDQLLQSLDGLTADHAALLALLRHPPENNGRHAWPPEDLEREAAMPPTTFRLCLASLEARGLASRRQVGMIGTAPVLTLSGAGRLVLDVLSEYVAAEEAR